MHALSPSSKKSKCCRAFFYGVSCAFLLIVFTVVIISTFRSNKGESIVRIAANGASATGFLDGYFELDSSAGAISYWFFYNTSSPIIALNIHGAREPGQSTAPISFALCGIGTVCDVSTVPGQLKSSLLQVYPGPVSVVNHISNLRDGAFRYYMEVLTGAFPTSPGEMRIPLNAITAFSI